MNRKQKISFVLNFLIFLFTVFATVSMMIGFNFMSGEKVLSSTSFQAFKYFTVDSNVIAGFVSLVYMIYLCLLAKGKIKEMPKFMSYLKLASTTGVTLTMMVTICFLAPRSTTTYFAYFMNSNFFMHFLTPLLCIITFAFFEPVKLSFKQSCYGTCFMILYAIFYIPNILLHLDNGKVLPEYDWYGFLFGGLNTIWFVIPLLWLITWLFSICLWYVNKKCSK